MFEESLSVPSSCILRLTIHFENNAVLDMGTQT